MQVRDVMTTGIQACHAENTLAEAIASMWKWDSDSLPVIDWEDRILGQISDRDVQTALGRTTHTATEVSVGEAMSHTVTTCSPDDDLHRALHVMRESRSARLPVVDPDRKLLGVFSLKALLERRRESDDDMGVAESELLEFSYGDL